MNMSRLEGLASPFFQASPAAWIQALFALTSCFVLAITVAPAAERKLLLSYGPRRGHGSAAAGVASEQQRQQQQTVAKQDHEAGDLLVRAVGKLTSLGQVPHSWFFTYYAFYLVCAGFWAVQYFQGGSNLLRSLAGRQAEVSQGSATMSGSQVVIVWCMMQLQASRRLYECFAVMKSSQSTMWFVHWVLGLGFYLGVSMAIWVEGSDDVLQNQLQITSDSLTACAEVKAAVALPLFLYGWVMQHRCHKHLAGLKKYSLPDLGMFRHLVCPHYTCECLIYLSLALVAAPKGQWCNRTLLSVFTFVAVNLGVTAHGTRDWYIEKFGPERVMRKWIMIPLLY